jgi:hypothetical protein
MAYFSDPRKSGLPYAICMLKLIALLAGKQLLIGL